MRVCVAMGYLPPLAFFGSAFEAFLVVLLAALSLPLLLAPLLPLSLPFSPPLEAARLAPCFSPRSCVRLPAIALRSSAVYCASAARTMYGISKNGFMPKIFQYLTPHGNPIAAITLNFFLCLSVFAPLPGWNSIAGFLTSLFAMTYIIGPVCFVALRQQLPYQYRPLKLPLGYAWALIAFYICTLLAYWSGWMINLKMTIILIVGYGLFLGYHWTRGKKSTFKLDFMSSLWLWTFLLGLDFFSYMGNFGGGKNILSWPEEMIGLFIFSIFNLWLARAFCLPAEETQKHIDELNLSHHH
ncbi:MAG: APC family permease [Proteobacteria bacterium]|nr:APC family permease [Pseudomonadota bacterium]